MTPEVMRNLLNIVAFLKVKGWEEAIDNGIKLTKGRDYERGNNNGDHVAEVTLFHETGKYTARVQTNIFYHACTKHTETHLIAGYDPDRLVVAIDQAVEAHREYYA